MGPLTLISLTHFGPFLKIDVFFKIKYIRKSNLFFSRRDFLRRANARDNGPDFGQRRETLMRKTLG